MDISIEGGCFCGEIRYRISVEPLSAGICHCVSCRRAVGAESVSWATVRTSGFEFLRTKPRSYNSSKGVTRTFCPRCGTSLTYQNTSESIDITLASLDDPERLSPTEEIWSESRISWNALHGSIPVHMKAAQ